MLFFSPVLATTTHSLSETKASQLGFSDYYRLKRQVAGDCLLGITGQNVVHVEDFNRSDLVDIDYFYVIGFEIHHQAIIPRFW